MKFVKLAFLLSFIAGILVLNAADSHAPKKQTKDDNRGKTLYMTCQPCHGSVGQGNPITNAPAIAGMESWYLNVQIKKFKNGVRGAHPEDVAGLQMRPMARTLVSDEDVVAVSDYIESLPHYPAKKTVKGDAAKGKVAYNNCVACHGANAEGNKLMKGPALVRLPDWYIVSQLEKFKTGLRGTHHKDITGMQMRPAAQQLNAEMRNDIAVYIGSLNSGSEKAADSKSSDH